jgi:hypothetical protein
MSTISSSQPDVAIRLKCQICSALEAIHRDRIRTSVRLMEDLNRSSSRKCRTELQTAISKIQTELDEAWMRLAAHRKLHASGSEIQPFTKMLYCGADTPLLSNDGRPICVHCEADLETGRKLPQRESEVKAKRLQPPDRRRIMKYIVAWMLGVPGFLVVLWFLFNHGH